MRNCDSDLRFAVDSAPIAMVNAKAAENSGQVPASCTPAASTAQPPAWASMKVPERFTAYSYWLLTMPPSLPALVHAANHITKWLHTSIRYCPPMLVHYASAAAEKKRP
jgi:hypothetical protein